MPRNSLTLAAVLLVAALLLTLGTAMPWLDSDVSSHRGSPTLQAAADHTVPPSEAPGAEKAVTVAFKERR